MSAVFSQKLTGLEAETGLRQIALLEGLLMREQIGFIGTRSLVQALGNENDLLKKSLRTALPPDTGNVNSASMDNLEYGTQSLNKKVESIASETSQIESLSPAKSTGPVRAKPSADLIVTSNSGNEIGSTPNKSTKSKQLRTPQKNPARFPCTDCGKRFTRSTTLRDHMRSHSNERPFQCSLCSLRFALLKDKKRHELLHSEEKKYICKGINSEGDGAFGCEGKFAREDGLLAHWRTKTGQRCLAESIELKSIELKVFNRIDFTLVEEGGQGGPFQCAKIVDRMARWAEAGMSRSHGCEKSYQSGRDLWNQHLSLDEGRDCLRGLLITFALEASRTWEDERRYLEDGDGNDESSEIQ